MGDYFSIKYAFYILISKSFVRNITYIYIYITEILLKVTLNTINQL